MGFSKSSCRREVYSDIILPQETRKASTDNLYLYPKQAGERRTAATIKQPKISRRKKKIIKTRAEINEKEKKEKIERLIKLKAGSLRRQTKFTNH